MKSTFEAILRGPEIDSVKQLARLFEKGKTTLDKKEDFEAAGLGDENAKPMLAAFVEYGIVNRVQLGDLPVWIYKISPLVIQYARQIEQSEQEKERGQDIVAQTTDAFRRHPISGRVVFWWIVLTGLLVMVAAVLTIIEKVISLFKTTAPNLH